MWVLAISAGVALALYTAVYWTLSMTESVSGYLTLSRGGARQDDSPASAVEAHSALTTTIVTIAIQCLLLVGIAFAITRIHGARPLHRCRLHQNPGRGAGSMPPGSSRPRR